MKRFLIAAGITLGALLLMSISLRSPEWTAADYGKDIALAIGMGILGIAIGGGLYLALSRWLGKRWYTSVVGAIVSGFLSAIVGMIGAALLMRVLHVETMTSHQLIDMWGALVMLEFGLLCGVVGAVFGAGVGQVGFKKKAATDEADEENGD